MRADSGSHDSLEVGNALRLDALALCFLFFLLQDEVHAQGILLGLLFRLNRTFQHGWQLHITQQHVLHDHSAWSELLGQFVLNLLLHEFAGVGIERVGGVRRSGCANGRAQRGLDDLLAIVLADGLVHLRGHVFVQMKKQGSVEREDQSFVVRNVGALLDGLRLDGKFLHRLQRIDQMNAFRKGFPRHFTEQCQHPYVSGGNGSRARHQQDEQHDQKPKLYDPLPDAA